MWAAGLVGTSGRPGEQRDNKGGGGICEDAGCGSIGVGGRERGGVAPEAVWGGG